MLRKLKDWLGSSPANESASLLEAELFPADSEKFLANPYPYYERLRKEAPIHRTHEGFLVLSRYHDVVEALGDGRLGNRPSRYSTLHASKAERFACASLARNIMPFLDGPEHKDQRKIIGRLFQKQVKTLESGLPDIARIHLAKLESEFEVMADFATPFAREVIDTLLGFPPGEEVEKWSDLFFYLFTQIPSAEIRDEVNEALTSFRAWIAPLLESSGTGLVADFRQAIEGGELTKEVAIDSLILLFCDGLENVDTGVATGFSLFAEHPEEWLKLCQNPELIDSAVAECLRYDSPAQYVARTILEDSEWNGIELKKDFNILLLLGSANRDSEVFPEPNRFDIARSPNPHLSFGRGKHSCLGGKLVEKEMRAVFRKLAIEKRSFERTAAPSWQKRKGHHWIEAAPFRFLE